MCVRVFQTVQSECSLSEESGAKLNISAAVLEESLQIHETAEGQFLFYETIMLREGAGVVRGGRSQRWGGVKAFVT